MYQNIILKQLVHHAHGVLQNNDLGTSTKPAPHLYPHQWNWDSAFIAIGLSHMRQERAQLELKTLLQAQWSNGMVPHIVFNSGARNYYPGPEYWDTDIPGSPANIRTSGITQPPVIALAALEIFKNARDKSAASEFLKDIYPHLLLEERFLGNARDPFDEGLSFICHPWESGMDNSAIWDKPLNNFEMEFDPNFIRKDTQSIPTDQRPSDAEYIRYSYLVQRYAREGWDQSKIFELRHFVVQSVLFNVLHLKARQSLVEIAKLIGENADPIEAAIQQSLNSFERKLWNKNRESYLDYDMGHKASIDTENISQFIPLFAGIPNSDQAEILIAKLQSEVFWPDQHYGICTQSQKSSKYHPKRYWRGPVWVNMNWMIIKGLEKYKRPELANRLAHETLQLVEENGFYEYFNPETGQGMGADSFSWTAALIIDLIISGYE